MKKLLCLISAILILTLTGCGSGSAKTEDIGFTHNGTEIVMKAPAAPVLGSLGEPLAYTEETSCAFDGLDKTYYYGGFYLTTYPEGDEDYVFSLWFADDSVSTSEGIRIGSNQSEVDAAYGAEHFNGINAYVITAGETKLTIVITDGAVSSVLYEAVFE